MSKIRKIIGSVGNFIRESVRPRTKEDYRILIAPRDEDREKISRYPWLYIRVFALLLVLLSVSCILHCVFGSGYENLHILGSMLIAVPYLVLLYEIFPKRTLGLFTVLLIMFAGGLLSILIFWKRIVPVSDELVIYPFCVGFFEEIWKGVPVIAAILLLKRKNATDGLIIGAAVGAGFGIIENTGYIDHYIYYRSAEFGDYLLCVAERNADMIVTHIFWSGLIGYAFLKFRRAWMNPKFYGCVALSMALHGAWDYFCGDYLPDFLTIDVTFMDYSLTCFIGWIIIIAVGVGFLIGILKSERRGAFPEEDGDVPKTKFGYRHVAALSLAVSICASATALCLYPVFHNDEKTREYVCTGVTVEEFIADRQMGRVIEFEENRPYDPNVENYDERRYEGKLITATQLVPAGDGEYYIYVYDFDDGEETLTCYYAYEEIDEETGEKWMNWIDEFELEPLGYSPEYTLYCGVPVKVDPEEEVKFITFFDLKYYMNDDEKRCDSYYYGEDGMVYYKSDPIDAPFINGVADIITVSAAGALLAAGIALFVTFSVKAKRSRKEETSEGETE